MIYMYEDEPDFRTELQEYLEGLGFSVQSGSRVSDISAFLQEQEALTEDDIVLLDLTLEGKSAFEFIPKIRRTLASCIVLTGNLGETERVIGLELGADDYISKTASPREIAARIKSVLRRRNRTDMPGNAENSQRGWKLDKIRCVVHGPSGHKVNLTVAEMKLLARLEEAMGTIVPREELTTIALRKTYYSTDRSLDNLVARVRNKFRPITGDAPIIKAARHVGYIFIGFPEIETKPNQGNAANGHAPEFVIGSSSLPAARSL